MILFVYFFFFFQAEDGIRDADVTGVQTCALPILVTYEELRAQFWPSVAIENYKHSLGNSMLEIRKTLNDSAQNPLYIKTVRSEERRVGKECRYQCWRYH